MKKGDILNIIHTHPSFTWANGLYVFLRVNKDSIIEMVKIKDDYSLQSFEDGRWMISCIGKKNEVVHKTKMTYKLK